MWPRRLLVCKETRCDRTVLRSDAVFVLASVALVVLILLHSGKGTGVSEMFGGMLPSDVDRHRHHREEPRPNHDRHAVVWTVCLLIMMVAYPKL